MSWIKNKTLSAALKVQIFITLIAASVTLVAYDAQIALSAVLGGMIGVVPSAVYALMVSHHKGYTTGGTIRTALRAEAAKIILTIILLWAAFAFYESVNAIALIGTFVMTVLVYGTVLLVSEEIRR